MKTFDAHFRSESFNREHVFIKYRTAAIYNKSLLAFYFFFFLPWAVLKLSRIEVHLLISEERSLMLDSIEESAKRDWTSINDFAMLLVRK